MAVSVPQRPSQLRDGVIEEARRRQHRRRLRGLAALVLVALIAALGWALAGGSPNAAPRSHPANRAGALDVTDVKPTGFNVRLYPTTTVGEAGWCEVSEEDGKVGGSACGGAPTTSIPFLMVMGFGEGNSPITTTFAVTIPAVASIEVNGKQRVLPVAVPGLPYGLRAARIVTSSTEHLTPAMKRAVRRQGTVLVAFNAQGRRIPRGRVFARHPQARVISWRYPSRPADGSCQLSAKGMPGLIARAGKVATDIRPFPGKLVGQAFLPCAETQYSLHGGPIRALIMLNAANPSALAAALPNFKPAPHAPGYFAEGSVTAARDGKFWLVVGQGASRHQQIEVLRHLNATVHLHARARFQSPFRRSSRMPARSAPRA
jgi:hypothetical protein